ncbi:unnamed protein product [Pleuronectes platessa]|uniref:Uncharacterized protein n=1 Tax=Pleuronectes platessa TaxID=8262 RepID=A0A9N7YSJ1_PLEPL|nr:unnamed protein product [Pleuronectes platessa]
MLCRASKSDHTSNSSGVAALKTSHLDLDRVRAPRPKSGSGSRRPQRCRPVSSQTKFVRALLLFGSGPFHTPRLVQGARGRVPGGRQLQTAQFVNGAITKPGSLDFLRLHAHTTASVQGLWRSCDHIASLRRPCSLLDEAQRVGSVRFLLEGTGRLSGSELENLTHTSRWVRSGDKQYILRGA